MLFLSAESANKQEVQHNMLKPQHTDFGRGTALWQEGLGNGPKLHFSAANGFPLQSYNFFLAHFAPHFQLIGLENRGMWDSAAPPRGFSWRQHAEDLIAFLDYQNTKLNTGPIIAMGHSIGATVTALAAERRPDLFKALLMFDPAAIPGRILPTVAAFAPSQLMGQLNLVKRTRGRRLYWDSPQSFIDYHRHKPAYRRFTEQALSDYAQAALIAQGVGKFKLAYSRDWEAHNFQHTYSPWQALRHIQVPTLILRAEHSYLHKAADFQRNTRRLPAEVSCATITGAGHMVLQEDPEQIIQHSFDWLQGHGLMKAVKQ